MTRPRRLGRPGTSLVGHGLPGLIARTASGKWRVVDLWCILVHFQGSHAWSSRSGERGYNPGEM